MSYHCPGCGAQLKGPASVAAHAQWNPQCTKEMRFWGRTDKFSSPNGCWLYKGRLDALGYGRIDKSGPMTFAHRCAWIYTHGPIPADKDIMHHCDVRNCVNPAHMSLCTHTENMLDMRIKCRPANALKPAMVRAIREALKEDTARGAQKRIAERFGVDPQVVCGIHNNRKYTYFK